MLTFDLIFEKSTIIFTQNCVNARSTGFKDESRNIHIINSDLLFTSNNVTNFSSMFCSLEFLKNTKLLLSKNKLSDFSTGITYHHSLTVEKSQLLFTSNECSNTSYIFYGEGFITLNFNKNTTLLMSNNTLLEHSFGLHIQSRWIMDSSTILFIVNNCARNNGMIIYIDSKHLSADTLWQTNNATDLGVSKKANFRGKRECLRKSAERSTENGDDAHIKISSTVPSGGPGFLYTSNTFVSLSADILIQNNTVTDFGVLNVYNSKVHFQGKIECLRNSAERGIIYAENSDLYFSKDALFEGNTAVNGGAMFLKTSTMTVSQEGMVNFTLNHASQLGGAVYITNPGYSTTTIII